MEGSGNLDGYVYYLWGVKLLVSRLTKVHRSNFTVDYYTLPGDIIQTNSVNMGNFSGSLDALELANPYEGAVIASPTSDTGSSDVVFGRESPQFGYIWMHETNPRSPVRIVPQSVMKFTIFDYTGSSEATLESRDVALASAQVSRARVADICSFGTNTR